MRWIAVVLLLVSFGRALGQESTAETGRYDAEAYDQAIIRFNTGIKTFPSWEAFKSEVLSRVSPDTWGTCYALTGDVIQPVEVTRRRFKEKEVVEDRWRKTSGKGWRRIKDDRTFVEYRYNKRSDLLLRMEGVKPRFFFARTLQLCEFPL